jgi:hypothetical protein
MLARLFRVFAMLIVTLGASSTPSIAKVGGTFFGQYLCEGDGNTLAAPKNMMPSTVIMTITKIPFLMILDQIRPNAMGHSEWPLAYLPDSTSVHSFQEPRLADYDRAKHTLIVSIGDLAFLGTCTRLPTQQVSTPPATPPIPAQISCADRDKQIATSLARQEQLARALAIAGQTSNPEGNTRMVQAMIDVEKQRAAFASRAPCS